MKKRSKKLTKGQVKVLEKGFFDFSVKGTAHKKACRLLDRLHK